MESPWKRMRAPGAKAAIGSAAGRPASAQASRRTMGESDFMELVRRQLGLSSRLVSVEKLSDKVALFRAVGLGDEPIEHFAFWEGVTLATLKSLRDRDIARDDARDLAVLDALNLN